MAEAQIEFATRLKAIDRKHSRMERGFSTKVSRDGLLIAVPKPRRGVGSFGPLKFIIIVALGFIAFKAFALASFGPATYNIRLAKLEAGTIVEQIGAKALAIDPLTAAIAEAVGPILR